MQERQIHGQSEHLFQQGPSVVLSMMDLVHVVNLPPDSWQVTLRNGATSGAQCWSPLFANLAFSSSCSQVSHSEWKSILSSPCITPISGTKREKCVAVNKDERRWISEECFDIRHGDAEFGV